MDTVSGEADRRDPHPATSRNGPGPSLHSGWQGVVFDNIPSIPAIRFTKSSSTRPRLLAANRRRELRRILAERGGQIDQVFLFVHEDLANVLADRVFAERFALLLTLAVFESRDALVLEVEAQHVFGLVGELHFLRRGGDVAAEVVDQD